ncbi:hypothetical protein GH810_02635 [Acetobacterium paludosum]|uniref:PilN domain-containing protein n=1 Tax=Acetobacterium paludosum TaxID=52693 RepID=A0A923I152_9FIRM|nr:PilN domain-containing protein [Acetobacterium paludosum]MBC3887205.1 hypothetical protein [Acetobacterium paludosum]
MKTEINLLPIRSRKKKPGKVSGRKLWILAIWGTAILFLMAYGSLVVMNQVLLNRIQQVEEVIRNKSGDQIIYQNISDQNELLEYQNKLKKVLTRNKDTSLKALNGVNDSLPTGVNLIEYTYIDGKLIVSGRTKNQEDIFQFRDKLMTQELFKNVSIQDTAKKSLLETEHKNTINEVLNENIWEFTFEIETTEVQYE